MRERWRDRESRGWLVGRWVGLQLPAFFSLCRKDFPRWNPFCVQKFLRRSILPCDAIIRLCPDGISAIPSNASTT